MILMPKRHELYVLYHVKISVRETEDNISIFVS